VRDCSAYSRTDIYIGVYNSLLLAKQAAADYKRIMALHDPWAVQAHHSTDLEEDLRFVSIVKNVAPGEPLYLLLRY